MYLRIALFLFLAALASSARAEAPAVQNGKCPPGGTVIVEVRGVPLLVPRKAGFRLTFDDGKTHMTLGRPVRDYTCDTPVVKNVRGISAHGYKIGLTSGSKNPEKSFNDFRSAARAASKLRTARTEKLASGIEKITVPETGGVFFRLPQDAAPTFDKEPVTFICDNSTDESQARILPRFCTTAYLHPSGLAFTYGVMWSDYPGDDFIAADKAKRKFLDDMVEGAKEKNSLKSKIRNFFPTR